MARNFEDSSSLARELAEGEKILWKGAPEAFPLMTEDSKKGMTRCWLTAIVLAVVIIAVYIVLSAKAADGISAVLPIIVLLGVAYYAAMPVMDRNNIYKKCRYYITDRRVIFEHGQRDYYSLPLTGLKVDIAPGEEGCIHVDLGSCVGIPSGKRRVSAVVPKKDDNENICGFVMYNVADSAELRSLLGK